MNVFLSYSHQDREWAKVVAERLRAADFSVWNAETDLYPGENFATRVAEALDTADAMVLLVSPEALDSRWVRHEIDFALGSARLAGRLIPVVVRPTDHLPWILRKLKTITPKDGGGAAAAADTIVDVLRLAA